MTIDPDTGHTLLPADRRRTQRPLQRDDDVVGADCEQEIILLGDRAEDENVRTGEIRRDGNLVGRDPDVELFGKGPDGPLL